MKKFCLTELNLTTIIRKNRHNLNGSDLKILFALLENITHGGKVVKPQRMIGEKWGFDPSRFSASMRKLKNLNILSVKRDNYNLRYIQFNKDLILMHDDLCLLE